MRKIKVWWNHLPTRTREFITISILMLGVFILPISFMGGGYDIEAEAIYQIRNSDSVNVNRNRNYNGYTGTFTDTYGRIYEFNTTQEIGGLFLEIDTVYTCKIHPKHNAEDVEFKNKKYQKEFFNYAQRVYKYYNK